MQGMTSVLGAALLCASCAHEVDTYYGQTRGPVRASREPAALAAARSQCREDLECGDGFLCVREQCLRITAALSECQSGRVHFDWNEVSLHSEDYPVLQRVARCLRADHSMHIQIDGNADERGTTEYNLALGDRRARGVAEYLRVLGATEPQLATVSYGKLNPLCDDHTESCWQENRRAGLTASR